MNPTSSLIEQENKEEAKMGPVGFKNKFLNIWESIPGLLRLIIIYALLNGALYAGQEIYYFNDTQRMNQLESEMSTIDKKITFLESYATDGGLPEPQYSQYKNNIDEYNRKADEYNRLTKKSGSRWWLIPIPIGRGKTALK